MPKTANSDKNWSANLMATIKMYNVEFGECILMSEGNQGLLIDCGTDSGPQALPFSHLISDLNTVSYRQLMISHFHDDHINGIHELIKHYPRSFYRIFLPNIFNTENRFISLILLREYLQIRTVSFGTTSDIWSLLKKLLLHRYRLTPLHRGNTFSVVNSNWIVYSPNPRQESLKDLFDNAKSRIIKEIERTNNANKEMDLLSVEDLFNDLKKEGELICQVVNNYIEKYREIREDSPEYVAQMDGMIREIDKLQVSVLSNLLSKSILGTKVVKNIISYIQKKENENSIVCEAMTHDDKRLLFTGDITPGKFKKIIPELIDPIRPFYCVKAPHHGTESYFVNLKSLDPQNIIISNGYSHIPSHAGISNQYRQIGIAKIICTNGKCAQATRRGAQATRKCAIPQCPKKDHKCMQGDIIV